MVYRGEIYYADLSPATGSEQGGIRPVLIIQNDIGNKFSPTTIVAAITTQEKRSLPTHVGVGVSRENGLKQRSTVMLEQIRSIDKRRIRERIGKLEDEDLVDVMKAMQVSLGMM